jgi:hypothetical protein
VNLLRIELYRGTINYFRLLTGVANLVPTGFLLTFKRSLAFIWRADLKSVESTQVRIAPDRYERLRHFTSDGM